MQYKFFGVNQIHPEGWIKRQMERDINESIITKYDQILSNLTQELFAKQERNSGTLYDGNRGEKEIAWWAGEHEGYYFDGMLRMAILTGNQFWIQRVGNYVEKILQKAEETGYIGIYNKETRCSLKGRDGELWTQSRIFQMLSAWYDLTKDSRLLPAVEKCVDETMTCYMNYGTYFGREEYDGGVGHAIGYFDTLEWLYRTTGNEKYLRYGQWLCNDMEKSRIDDLTASYLDDPNKKWRSHAPHMAEGLQLHAFLSETGDPDEIRRSDRVLELLKYHTNPGGGLLATNVREAIDGEPGAGDYCNEYCAKTESVPTLNRSMLYRPNRYCGDWIERCAFNTAQAARFSDKLNAVMYLSRDNQYGADEEDVSNSKEIFSASHKAALCCNLNAIRMMPYYMEGMFLRGVDGSVLINLYGPGKVEFRMDGQPAEIRQETNYPFSDTIALGVKIPGTMKLRLRIPGFCTFMEIDGEKYSSDQEFAEITVSGTRTVAIRFHNEIRLLEQEAGGEYYFMRGALVYSMPIASEIIPCGAFELEGFDDYLVKPTEKLPKILLNDQLSAEYHDDGCQTADFTSCSQSICAKVLADGKLQEVRLTPMGTSHLHQTTFVKDGDIKQDRIEKSKVKEDVMRFF